MALDIVHSVHEEMGGDDGGNGLDILQYIIPQGIEVPKPESVFELSGIPVFTKKSISTLIGKAKSGKTTVTAWLVAQCIRMNMTVVWLDTEQGEYYGSRTQHWILSIAGIELYANLKYVDVRVLKPTERFAVLEQSIAMFSPDLVIVDGIRDLVFDINDPNEATLRSGDMMRLAQSFECHILSVLHTNKGNDNARGHLGTEMINKSETVISIDKDGEMIVANPEFTRSEPFKPFAFVRDTYSLPQLVEDYMGHSEVTVGKRSIQASDYTLDEHRLMLKLVFINDEKLAYSDFLNGLIAGYGTHGISIGEKKAKAFIEHLKQQNVVHGEREGKFTYYSLINRISDV